MADLNIDNLELIKKLLMKDERVIKVLATMYQKSNGKDYGSISMTYQNGKIDCINNSTKIK